MFRWRNLECFKILITCLIASTGSFFLMWTVRKDISYRFQPDSLRGGASKLLSFGCLLNSNCSDAKATEIIEPSQLDQTETLPAEKVPLDIKKGDITNKVQGVTEKMFGQLNTSATSTTGKSEYTQTEKLKAPTTMDFSWKTLSKGWKLFSSYIDNRSFELQNSVYEKSLVTLGNEKDLGNNELHCVVIWANNTRSVLEDQVLRDKVSPNPGPSFQPYLYRCRLPIMESPLYMTFITSKNTNFDSIPSSSFIPVVDPKSSTVYKFGVCVQGPLAGQKYRQIIVDFVEMSRLLGAEWFTVYVHDAHQEALDILRTYAREGILDAVFNWGDNMPSPTFYRAQNIAVHDCLYRNMHKIRYLVFCDFDEIIVPRMHLDWHGLLDAIDSDNRCTFRFRMVPFHRNLSGETEDLMCTGNINKTYHMPQFLATRNRSVDVFPTGRAGKFIIKPGLLLTVVIHCSARQTSNRYRRFRVPQHLALVQHFRDKDHSKYRKYNSTIDNSMERYKTALLVAVKKRICSEI